MIAVSAGLALAAQDLHYHETGGYGTENTFGLSGEVYRVTNLNKDGEGSLRSFLEMSGPRLIVFEVGGIIDLEETDLRITEGQVCIAGQTAPFPGITIIKGGMVIRADEVLVQHLTIRPGDGGHTEATGWRPDGFSVSSGNVVLDHCSVSWAVDENMSVARGGNNVTFYRCIIAEGLSNSIHEKGEHSCGSLVTFDTKNISIIGNLYAHNYRRHPRYADGATLLFSNNVIYNYGIYASHVGANPGAGDPDDPGVGDFISNAYFKGVDGWDDYMLEIHRGDFDKINPPAVGKAFMEGNLGLNRLTGEALVAHDEHVTILDTPQMMTEGFKPGTAYDIIGDVLKYAGARPGERSETDRRIVQSLIDGNGSVIDSQAEVEGYPVFQDTIRVIEEIPGTASERRAWLDSISTSLEEVTGLDVSGLYAFIDEHDNTSVESAGAFSLQAYAAQGAEKIILKFNLDDPGSLRVSLVDLQGRNLYLEQDLSGHAGENEHHISLNEINLPDGIYFLNLSDGEQSCSEKLLIHR